MLGFFQNSSQKIQYIIIIANKIYTQFCAHELYSSDRSYYELRVKWKRLLRRQVE